MRKIAAVSLLALLPFAAYKSYDCADGNLDIARALFAERALEFGRKDVFDAQMAKVKNAANISADIRAANLKKEIAESPALPNADIFKFLSSRSRADEKFLVCGLAAEKCFNNGDIRNAALYLSICGSLLDGTNPTVVEFAVLDIVDRLAAVELKQAQAAAVDLLFRLYYTHDMVLRIYKLGGRKYCAERLAELFKDKDFCGKHKAFVKYEGRVKIIGAIDKYKEDYVARNFFYSAIEFAMSWRIQKWEDYKNPLLAHVYYCCGNEAMYKKYRGKSVSPRQLHEMRAAYFAYVEYAAKIFCMANDTQIAIDLIKTLPDGHAKNRVLKRLARYLTPNKEAFETTLKSGLFD